MSKKLRRLQELARNRQLAVFYIVGIFIVIGTTFLLMTRAASPTLSAEPENGQVAGPATVASDATASGGKYIKFGTAPTPPPPTPSPTPTPTPTPGSGGHTNLTPPIRAAFYYPWFPETWNVGGVHVKYHPTLGYYDSSDPTVIDSHIRSMQYAGIKVDIASWWGQGQQKENIRIPLILQHTQALGTGLKWAMYYEKEGFGDPSVSEIQADLQYIKANYATSPSYAYVNGKPVIFVYNASANDNSCALSNKWAQANASTGFYVDLKVFANYKTCSPQPDSWHQYGPASAVNSVPGYSYAISAGFWKANESAPRLARDPARYTQNVSDMVTSGAPWQLITTFDEWGEGTAIESATEWASPSGQGLYLDALHNKQ